MCLCVVATGTSAECRNSGHILLGSMDKHMRDVTQRYSRLQSKPVGDMQGGDDQRLGHNWGYLSSEVTVEQGYGSAGCPWRIQVSYNFFVSRNG